MKSNVFYLRCIEELPEGGQCVYTLNKKYKATYNKSRDVYILFDDRLLRNSLTPSFAIIHFKIIKFLYGK